MLSPFLKKLIFVRKFFIIDGRIEILGQRQFLLPSSVMESFKGEDAFEVFNSEVKKTMVSYAKSIGASSGGMVKSVQDIYETMGLGKMRIIKLDADKKNAVIRIEKANTNNSDLIGGVISGLFSCVFTKNLTKSNVSVKKKVTYYDVSIK
jgi:hypothetical protein